LRVRGSQLLGELHQQVHVVRGPRLAGLVVHKIGEHLRHRLLAHGLRDLAQIGRCNVDEELTEAALAVDDQRVLCE
jgi:hypothetical protein